MAKLARATEPMVRDLAPQRAGVRVGDPARRGAPLRVATWDEALERAAAGFKRVVDERGPQAFGLFSCSKSTNEMNFAAQNFARVVIGSNNIDSCNRT